MTLFDAHAHYDDLRFDTEFDGGGIAALTKAHALGVRYIANIGSNLKTSKNSVALAERFDFVVAAVGIHPSDAQEIPALEVDRALAEVEKMAKEHEKVRAIGEIGYDYHYDDTDIERQTYFFTAQMEIARRLSLPVVIHSRDASGDTFDLLARHPDVTGVLHSYSGSAENARQLAAKGWYLSFSGPVTYKNANKVKESAAIVSDDRILIETDCPYLPPVPHRGELNYSGYLPFTCAAVAEARQCPVEEVARLTYENACRFYGIRE